MGFLSKDFRQIEGSKTSSVRFGELLWQTLKSKHLWEYMRDVGIDRLLHTWESFLAPKHLHPAEILHHAWMSLMSNMKDRPISTGACNGYKVSMGIPKGIVGWECQNPYLYISRPPQVFPRWRWVFPHC